MGHGDEVAVIVLADAPVATSKISGILINMGVCWQGKYERIKDKG
jgi:hypothetical protein